MTKNLLKLFFLALCFMAPSSAPCQETTSTRALKILNNIDDMWRGASSRSVVVMNVQTANYKRDMRMEMWSKGKERSLARIISPLKEKGTATLKSGTNIYTYLPKTGRTIRLTSGMMMNSWMGSHFTNDDIVKESRFVEDYHASITFEGERRGKEILEFTLLPKENAAVVWGKIVLLILADNLIPLEEIYYDEEMVEIRRMVFSGVKKMDGRLLPSILRMEPRDKDGEFTEVIYEELSFDIGLKDSFFSLSRIKRK